jgi:hypothetical protein
MATIGTGRGPLIRTKSSGGGGLFSFTSFTFTNAATSGSNGPTYSTYQSVYDTASNPWLTNTAYFNCTTNGYQLFTIPATGTYRITAQGAAGGQGTSGYGYAAYIQATFNFTQGDKYIFIAGQMGSSSTSGCAYGLGSGGGGSFVINQTGQVYLAVGGGGGGAYTSIYGNQSASLSTTGSSGSAGGTVGGTGGTNGNGGNVSNIGCVGGGGGGGGMSSAGGNASSGGFGGNSYGFGFTGGSGTLAGGFGGGGGSSAYCGGGGGGYSGGGGGSLSSCSCTALGSGGGGGSYLYSSGTLITQSTTYNWQYHGSILLEKL